MVLFDWIFIGVIVLFALIGMAIGFTRSLTFFTGGIFGLLACAGAAFFVGGMFSEMEFVKSTIESLDKWFIAQHEFLEYLKLGTVCYYLAIFIVLQIVRVIIVSGLKQLSEVENVVFRAINKTLGAAFLAAFVFAITLVVFALMAKFSSVSIVSTIIDKLENGFLYDIYVHNPIKF